MRKAFNPYTGIVVYVDNSVEQKQDVRDMLDELFYFDQWISDVYVSHGDVHRNTVKYWCIDHKINCVFGMNYLTNGGENHARKLVVYIGYLAETLTHKIAKLKAKQLGCDLIELPNNEGFSY